MDRFNHLIYGTLWATAVMIAHVILASVILLTIRIAEMVMHLLWQDGNPMLFDTVPLRYLFHAADVAVIIVYLWYGTMQAVKAFREH